MNKFLKLDNFLTTGQFFDNWTADLTVYLFYFENKELEKH